jgi:hypothetical protein
MGDIFLDLLMSYGQTTCILTLFTVRVGANVVETTPCAGRIGALEKSIRNYSETREEHVVEPALGMNLRQPEFRSKFHKVVNHMLISKGFSVQKLTSMQRSESANMMLKSYVPLGCAMNRFVKHYLRLQHDVHVVCS